MKTAGIRGVLLALPALTACGSNYADVPPELVDAIKHPEAPSRGDSGALGYPEGPYGTRVGDTTRNLCFEGWRNPKADDFDPAKAVPICIDEYFDPSGARSKLLLIESCAVWCVACRAEYGGSGNRLSLADHLAKRESQGFRTIGTIYQDASAEPATTQVAATWARTFDLTFPFAVDQDHLQLGQFSPPDIAPFNMLIDTRTMTIVLQVPGDEPGILFQKVDDFLATNAGP